MTSPRRALMSPTRRRLLARVHLLAKQSGLEEDAYRDLLERETGRRSAAVLGEPALARVVDVLEALAPGAAAAAAPGPFAGKLKALWVSGWHLGLVRDPSDAAMRAFLSRQTGLAAPRFLIEARAANAAIEGLKGWYERQAGVRWWEHPDNPRRAVAEAIVRRLDQLGDIKALDHGKTRFLEDYVCAVTGKNRGLHHCEAADWDRAIKALGARLRRAERLAAEKEAGR